jgi:thioredoxin reductase/Pyruvate/2-oxoacid:ferredoxin oxidoreductase delta subunit
MDKLITYGLPAIILAFFFLQYYRAKKKRDAQALAAAEKGKMHSSGPQSQHPHIDMTFCIGCAACTMICPEGDVLVMLGGKAVIANGHKCIGHSLCAESCPVGAITMVMASPSVGADNPYLTLEYETTIPNMFIVGELGGLALIKNAVNQGRDCVDTITKRLSGARQAEADVHDVVVVGSGPAGISAALRAAENKLDYVILEQEEMLGGTVAKYPKQKLVMTSPWQFPTYGKFKKTEVSKEELVAFWESVMKRADFKAKTGEKVTDIKNDEAGIFTVVSGKGQHRARAVVLALGKMGSPRKLGVKGEELPKVMYRLIEADHYVNKKIIVVGGGDSAVEAAMGLGSQVGNKVMLSYRKDAFARIKERNTQRIQEAMKAGTVKVVFNSAPVEIKPDSVMLEVNGKVEEVPNDFLWVFAGGEPPTAFLKKIGIGFGVQDVTSQVSSEAKEAKKEAAESKRSGAAEAAAAKKVSLDETARPVSPGKDLEATKSEKPPTETKLGIPGEGLPKVTYSLSNAQLYEGKDILVVGGSESAIRTALALGYLGRNRVTLAFSGDSLLATSRSRQLIAKLDEEKTVRVLKNTTVAKIDSNSIVMSVDGTLSEIPNDLVFILSKGVSPELPEAIEQAAQTAAGRGLG